MRLPLQGPEQAVCPAGDIGTLRVDMYGSVEVSCELIRFG